MSVSFAIPTVLLAAALVLPVAVSPDPSWAGPVVCTTTLEAPPPGSGVAGTQASGPVEVTRCAAVETTPQLVQRRFYSYTAPFAQGVSITNQITDLLGIAMGGGDGTRAMGFGFPDQAIIWDGTALENTYRVLLEQQSDPVPWRTADIANGFPASLGSGAVTGSTPIGVSSPWRGGGGWQDGGSSWTPPVRGLW